MTSIIKFILINYSWILIASTIILLAVIGYYASNASNTSNESEGENNYKNIEIERKKGSK